MTSAALLTDAFDRIRQVVHQAVDGLSDQRLVTQLEPGANSIAWLIWHLTRIQDDHLAGVAGTDQVWTTQGWAERFGLPLDPADTGYGHSGREMAAVRASADLLAGYHDATQEQTLRFVRGVTDEALDEIVDEAWDPPVTLGVRLVSVVSDNLQHAGQAAFVRGVLERR